MKQYKNVLFDIDDTLVDFRKSEAISLKKCWELFFPDHISEQEFIQNYKKINALLWQKVERQEICVSMVSSLRFLELARKHHLPFNKEIPLFYERQLIEHSCWIEGAQELLEKLLAAHVKIGFISNGITHMQRGKYDKLGLGKYSDVLVISGEVGVPKPEPKIFHHAMKLLGAKVKETLMVGDSLTSDGQGAFGVEMDFYWYNPHKIPSPLAWKPQRTLESFKELFTQEATNRSV